MPLSGNKSAIREATRVLSAHLNTVSSSLQQVYDQFPNHQQKMTFPSASVHAKKPVFEPLEHYVIAKSAITNIGTVDIPNNVATITKAVGRYDFAFQVDLWCAYKPQRDSIYEEIFAAFNQSDVPGVNLQLTNYYNEWCHYTIQDVDYSSDDEESVQTGEWRARITVLANVRAVVQKVTNVMQTIENNLETPASITAPEEDPGTLII